MRAVEMCSDDGEEAAFLAAVIERYEELIARLEGR